MLPSIAKRIRCQKACNRLATHRLALLDIFERSERLRERGDLKRGLSQDEIQERMSSCSQEMFSPSTKVATPETPSAAAMKRKRKRSDDGRQWGIRSDVNSAAYKAKELTARDGSEMCECGVSLDDCKCE